MKRNMGTEAYITFKTTPFKGFKLGVAFAGKMMVAVSQKKIDAAKSEGKHLCIFEKPDKYAKKSNKKETTLPPYMILDPHTIAEAFGEFEDKWGRDGKYILCYYEWKPIVQSTLFNY